MLCLCVAIPLRMALHKKSWAVVDRPYNLGFAIVGALYERPRSIFCAKALRILVITFAMESLQVVSRDRHLDVAEDRSRPDHFVIRNVTEHVLIARLLSG